MTATSSTSPDDHPRPAATPPPQSPAELAAQPQNPSPSTPPQPESPPDASAAPPQEKSPTASKPGPGKARRTRAAATQLRVPRVRKTKKPGSSPGVELNDLTALPSTRNVFISCIDYCPQQVIMQDIIDINHFLDQHRPTWSKVRWINIDGLTDMNVVKAIASKYQLHPLAIEDLLHTSQRPKFDVYPTDGDVPARLFVVTRMMYIRDDHLHHEQVSMFLGRNTLVTFQESRGDIWMPIRERINREGSRLRQNDASFLLYALLDALVDHCFPILEHYGDRLETLEEQILGASGEHKLSNIHAMKRELLILRRMAWPTRELIHSLQREPIENVSDITRTYLGDVYDHAVHILDLIETYREVAMALTETYMTAMSIRMNQVMKVLTIIATIFIPLTFLAGVYGMNFVHMPELAWKWAYPATWAVFLALGGGMLWWFKRKGWF